MSSQRVSQNIALDDTPTGVEEANSFEGQTGQALREKTLVNDLTEQKLKQQKRDSEAREKFECRAYWIAIVWLVLIVILTIFQFIKPSKRHLESSEYIAVVSTTTIAVFAFGGSLAGIYLASGKTDPLAKEPARV